MIKKITSCFIAISLFFLITACLCFAQGEWIISHEGVRIWNFHPVPGVSCFWTGAKNDSGKASGDGVIVWFQNGKITEVTAASLKNGIINHIYRQITGDGKVVVSQPDAGIKFQKQRTEDRQLSSYEEKQQKLCHCCLQEDQGCCAQVSGDCSKYGFSKEQSSIIKGQTRKIRKQLKKAYDAISD